MLKDELLEKSDALKNRIDVIKNLQGKCIYNFIRIGNFSSQMSASEKKSEHREYSENDFRSESGLFIIDTKEENTTIVVPVNNSDLFIKICEISRNSVENYLTNECLPLNMMLYDKTVYGVKYLSQFIGKKIDKVAIIKKKNSKREYEFYPIEKGVLLRFEGVNDGLAIGIELFPETGSLHVSCILEKDISENRNGMPEIVWLD